jgi:hypothetical protein
MVFVREIDSMQSAMTNYKWAILVLLAAAIVICGKMSRYEFDYNGGEAVLYDNWSKCYYLSYFSLNKVKVAVKNPLPYEQKPATSPEMELRRKSEAYREAVAYIEESRRTKTLHKPSVETVKICPLENIVEGFSKP